MAGSQIDAAFPVTGMSCAACAQSVASMIQSAPGVKTATVNYASQEVLVSYVPEITGPEKFQQALQSIGYDLILAPGRERELAEEYRLHHYQELKRNTLGAALLSLPVFVFGMFFHHTFPAQHYFSMVLTALVLFVFGKQFFVIAFRQAKHFQANMDALVALSTGIAFLVSTFSVFFPAVWTGSGLQAPIYFESAAMIVTFILFGRLLEERAKSRTGSALKKLIGIQPKTAIRLLAGDAEEVVGIESLLPDERIRIKPGDKVPVDGVVESGNSWVDESPINGESLPLEKHSGSMVFAGTLNQGGSLVIRVKKRGSETLLGQIITMVQQAQGSKAPLQKMADRIAGIFVPVVLVIALMTFLGWILFGGKEHLTEAFLSLVSVLIIACPCALGLATPTALMVGIGKGAANGILVRDAESLEKAAKVDTVVLDKTGTLTEGKPLLSNLHFFSDHDLVLNRNLLFAIEKQSEHPLAAAVCDALEKEKPENIALSGFESLAGKGVKALYKEDVFWAGSMAMAEEMMGVSPDIQAYIKSVSSLILFGRNKELLALLEFSDPLKPGSAEAVKLMQQAGIAVYMLSGDRQEVADVIALECGITHVKAACLPREKGTFISELQSQGRVVAMVGDGINDAAALALADVGIAMGKGTDIAMETAQITLVQSDLLHVMKALNLSRKTMKTIRQNLFWAFFYNTISIPLAAGLLYPFTGLLLDPMIAAAAMALSSVSVVSNSLRLRTIKL